MSYCFGEGCPHPAHLQEQQPKTPPKGQAGKPDWLRYCLTDQPNRHDRRRAQSIARKVHNPEQIQVG